MFSKSNYALEGAPSFKFLSSKPLMHLSNLSSLVYDLPDGWSLDPAGNFLTDWEAVPPQLPAPLSDPQRSARLILSSSISAYF